MLKETKISLFVAGVGLLVKQYESKKISQPNYYETNKPSEPISEGQLVLLGGAAFVGGLASAVIFETTKNNPKAKKMAFIGLGGLGVAMVASIIYALKKMT